MYAIKQIKICAEYWDVVHNAQAGLSGTSVLCIDPVYNILLPFCTSAITHKNMLKAANHWIIGVRIFNCLSFVQICVLLI